MRKLLLLLILTSTIARAQGGLSGVGNFGCQGTAVTGTVINSSTANNTVVETLSSFPAWGVLVQLDQTTTITAGAVTFNISFDGGANYIAVPVAQVLNPSTYQQLTNPYTLVASTNQSFLIPLNGATNFQIKLTTAMTGTGAITPFMTAMCTAPPGLQYDSSGNAKVNISAQSLGKVLVTPDALPANQSVNVAQVAGTTTDTNSGAKSAGTQRVVIATDQPQLTNKLLVTPDADVETIPMTNATTTNASLSCVLQSAASTNSTSCKGSAGNVYGIYIINTTTTNYFLRMYNSSTAPTCSSATGFIETIPALGAAANGGGIARVQVAQGYGTGIGFCLTGGGGSTDNTNAATGVYVTILYK